MFQINQIIKKQRDFFGTGRTKRVSFRLRQLELLKRAILENEAALAGALKADLNKTPYEAYISEIGFVLGELDYAIRHLRAWARPKRVKTPVAQFPSASHIYSEPYGVVLIMAPWNYPVQLSLAPLIGAMAAGNCCVIKPSEYSGRTARVIAGIAERYFDSAYLAVVLGDREKNRSLLEQKFDYIFFTGSARVGRIVMEAAAVHLTPVSLELGGKSPCIVDETADLRMAAKRIIWGKLLNAGQTCVAPDYVLVQQSVKNRLVYYMKKYIRLLYGKEPHQNPDYPHIINEKHFNRLAGLLKEEQRVYGGRAYPELLCIEPAILDGVGWGSPVMEEEIFGPILPVLEFSRLSEAASAVLKQPKPLACYIFTQDKRRARYLLQRLSFGGGCVNDTVMHIANPHMPFGGVGNSGMGGYHGKWSFETFSHKKSVLAKSTRMELPSRYPPYENHSFSFIKKIYGKAGELWTL